TGTSGTESHAVSATLVVTPINGFTISAPATGEGISGVSSATYNVSTTVVGSFSSSVTFGVSGLPNGASGTFNPGSVPAGSSSTLTVTPGSSTVAGNYTSRLPVRAAHLSRQRMPTCPSRTHPRRTHQPAAAAPR